MSTIEQAREVALDIRDVYADPLSLPIRAADTIDALIAERDRLANELTAAEIRIDNDSMKLERIKAQEPVGTVVDPTYVDMAEQLPYGTKLYLAAGAQERCQHCDDTGDVHSPDGEWRGKCDCKAGAPVPTPLDAQLVDTLLGQMEAKERKPPADEFGWRGILAANLHCWHRLTEAESDELVSFFGKLKEQRKPLSEWLPIDTCPQDGYFLVHEDGAIRLLLRIGGKWEKTGYPALVTTQWGDAIVGQDAERVLMPLGYRMEIRDGCCENPTHWMPSPDEPPEPAIKEQL